MRGDLSSLWKPQTILQSLFKSIICRSWWSWIFHLSLLSREISHKMVLATGYITGWFFMWQLQLLVCLSLGQQIVEHWERQLIKNIQIWIRLLFLDLLEVVSVIGILVPLQHKVYTIFNVQSLYRSLFHVIVITQFQNIRNFW